MTNKQQHNSKHTANIQTNNNTSFGHSIIANTYFIWSIPSESSVVTFQVDDVIMYHNHRNVFSSIPLISLSPLHSPPSPSPPLFLLPSSLLSPLPSFFLSPLPCTLSFLSSLLSPTLYLPLSPLPTLENVEIEFVA